MPILDPSLQYAFTDVKFYNKSEYGTFFLIKYLKIAACNIYKNQKTIEAAIQFKKDFKKCFNFFNLFFNCGFHSTDLENPVISNHYRFILDNISSRVTTKIPRGITGKYLILSNWMKFFTPNSAYKFYSWFLSDNQLAILGIRIYDIKLEYIDYLNLEIDLILAAGFTMVVSIYLTNNRCFNKLKYLISKTLSNHHFAEIHLRIDFNILKPYMIDELSTTILEYIDDIEGYFYLYTPFCDIISPSSKNILKKLKAKPRFYNISLSKDLSKSINFIATYLKDSNQFPYCKTGFESNKIKICLCNTSYYDSDNEQKESIPSGIINSTYAYMSPKDFLNSRKRRIPVLIECDKSFDLVEKFVYFEDIHDIKIDFYVKETLFMAKSDEKTLDKVHKILEKSSKIFEKEQEEDFKQLNIFTFFENNKISKGLIYVAYAYEHYIYNNELIKNFHFHLNQIFAIFDACNVSLLNDANSNNKGVIYQVETGEGKSCIIHSIAAVLALMKKTVHIASSNIKLSNRDYYDSYGFFQKLGLTSAVLLHYNELPYISFNNKENENSEYDKKYFHDEFFGEDLFQNSFKMNFSVCGIDNNDKIVKGRANIVFSTLINFECLYLKMMENYPSYISRYFNKCNLLIDEADSILIDELTNGTILSCPMKTNGSEVLKFIYKSKNENKSAQIILDEIHQNWPKCSDIEIDDIEEMFQEIELVNSQEFTNGKKYSVEIIDDKRNIIEKVKDKAKNIQKNISKNVKKSIKKIIKSDENDEISEEEDFNSMPLKEIIPFDYDHKGILEPNKEFGGYVQQFIAIKEMINNKENKNMVIKDLSMNYLYVSHPIFINLYKGVCGFTGTLGNKYDKEIYKEQYNLITRKIPRNEPNRRIEYPMLLCNDIDDRNKKIVDEVVKIHNKDIPILIIFQNLNEITDVFKMLISNGIKNINIFDGKDEKIRPDKISGLRKAVSLGTNFCGRGADIKNPELPLHIIISYYSSNYRVICQAFGRTARQGNEGTIRMICTKDQFIAPIYKFNSIDLQNSMNDFASKNQLQLKFIERYRENREWIFNCNIKSQTICPEFIEKLRNIKINVNRINAYEFKFPICMSINTFLDIQSQKILSLFNCPNCKYMWMLFQKYIREMILESWSIFITKIEKRFYSNKIKTTFSEYLNKEIEKLYEKLDFYFPDYDYDIVPTFMHITEIVVNKYEKNILKIIPKKFSFYYTKSQKKQLCSFIMGFKPFSLYSESSVRINTLNLPKQEFDYIKDPELKYMKQTPDGILTLSITEKIDGLFNLICKKINDVIGSYIGLKFFLRRTIGGCEFGVCLDFLLEDDCFDEKIGYNCLIDKNPLFLFAINVKSIIPLLAGIMIIGLVYIASISSSIADWIMNFPIKISKKLIVKTVKTVIEYLTEKAMTKQIKKFCNAICNFLYKILCKQIDNMNKYNSKMAEIFKILSKIVSKDFILEEKICDLFKENANMKIKLILDNFSNTNLPIKEFFKIGFLILLCFASFMMNFQTHNTSIKFDENKAAKKYDKKQNPQVSLEKNEKLIKTEKINPVSDQSDSE